MTEKPSNAWLIDVGYVVKAATDGNRFKLDYIAGKWFLDKRIGVTEAHLFNSIDPALGVPRGLQGFYNVMKRHGFGVHLYEMQGSLTDGTHKQAGVDEGLMAHLARLAAQPTITTITLTSGDGHFIPVVTEAKETHGARIVLFVYDVNVNGRLRALADEVVLFEDHRTQVARR